MVITFLKTWEQKKKNWEHGNKTIDEDEVFNMTRAWDKSLKFTIFIIYLRALIF